MQSRSNLFFVSCYFIACIGILFLFDGTGQEADSISHYLHAKFAPYYPHIYLDHWAKPIFTMLASPFAQFGIPGIKVFNVLCSGLAAYFMLLVTRELKLKQAPLTLLFYFIFPLSLLTTYSGFTEPLGAAVLLGSIYLLLKHKWTAAAMLISFTPFIRSEGLIFIGVFAAYFLLKKEWKSILLLFSGHLVFAIAGSFYHGSILWVFTKIPYARLSSHYGSGSLFHFAEQLNYMMGIPLLILFCLGVIYLITQLKHIRQERIQHMLIIFTFFLAFFIAHSLFWSLGIFSSLGLKRVFAAVSPIMAILCLMGYNQVLELVKGRLKNLIAFLIIAMVLAFPFTNNPAAVNWDDLNLSITQLNCHQVNQYLLENNLKDHRFIYTDPYLGVALDIDPFDKNKSLILHQNVFSELQPADIIIWDNQQAKIDFGVPEPDAKRYTFLKEIRTGKSRYKIYLYEQ